MHAVILAGGRGTRLWPYTATIPKPIVPVGDMAIMEIVVRQLAIAGIDTITVAVNHLAQLIMAYFQDGSQWGVRINYSLEDKPLSTMGPLRLIKDLPEHFLVMNGDILTDLNFGEFLQTHIDSGALGTVSVYERDVRIDFGVLQFNGRANRICGFVEKPTEHFCVSMGVYAFAREILDLIPADRPFGFDQLMLKVVAENRDVRALPHRGYWLDIGRPDDFARANEEFEQIKKFLLPD